MRKSLAVETENHELGQMENLGKGRELVSQTVIATPGPWRGR